MSNSVSFFISWFGFKKVVFTRPFWLCPGKGAATSITGTKLPVEDKVLRIFTSMGNIALACTYATVIYDIMVKHTIHLLCALF